MPAGPACLLATVKSPKSTASPNAATVTYSIVLITPLPPPIKDLVELPVAPPHAILELPCLPISTPFEELIRL